MTHVRDLIHRALEGDIAPAEQVRLDEHLGVCERCRHLSTELRRNDVLLAKREPLPAIPPRRKPGGRPLAFVRPALLGVATLLFALIAGIQLAGWRANPGPASSPMPAPSAVTRQGEVGVCAAARQQLWGVTRLDRIESKRMSMKDLMDGAGGDWPTRWTTQPDAKLQSLMVCVVAVSGEIRQQMGLIDTGPYKWGLFFSVAGSNETIGTRLGSDASWPPTFDALPDRRGEPNPGYVVEIVDPQTVRVKLESPMMSQEFGNPTLLRADKFTEINPSAPTIAATGVKVGDWVGVWFEREGRDATTGAYTISIFKILSVGPSLPPVPSGVGPCSQPQVGLQGGVVACPGSGPTGTQVTIVGTGCNNPGGPAIIYFGTAFDPSGVAVNGLFGSVELGRFAVDTNGSFRATFTVPSELNPIQGAGGGRVVDGLYRIYSKPEAFCSTTFKVGAPLITRADAISTVLPPAGDTVTRTEAKLVLASDLEAAGHGLSGLDRAADVWVVARWGRFGSDGWGVSLQRPGATQQPSQADGWRYLLINARTGEPYAGGGTSAEPAWWAGLPDLSSDPGR